MDAAEIQKQLDELEGKAEHLRALYEQYFMGIERLQPLVHRRDVERRIKLLRKEQIRNTAQRFKFNTIVQRFSLMQQHWARVVREIENGTYKRDVMRAAARFGDGAFAAAGKKKTREDERALAAAVASQPEFVEVEPDPEPEPLALGADDLIADEEDPPTLPGARVAVSAPRIGGLSALSQASRGRAPGEVAPARAGQPPLGAGSRPQPGAPEAAPVDVRQRVAALAAQARRPEPKEDRGGFGVIDVGFDGVPQGPPAVSRGAGVPPTAPAVAAPPRPAPRPQAPAATIGATIGAPLPAPRPLPSLRSPQGVGEQGFGEQGFGEIDVGLALDVVPVARPPAPATPQAVAPKVPPPPPPPRPAGPAGFRPRAPIPPAPVARAEAPAPPPPPARREDLAETRMREIYDKYVAARRSTQEPANLSYEKVAASLRAQSEKLRAQHPNRTVDYEVVVKDGKTHLRPVVR